MNNSPSKRDKILLSNGIFDVKNDPNHIVAYLQQETRRNLYLRMFFNDGGFYLP